MTKFFHIQTNEDNEGEWRCTVCRVLFVDGETCQCEEDDNE